ncbi:MAG: hypothetical protein ACKVX7_18920 [Planctomycetota bacterium]
MRWSLFIVPVFVAGFAAGYFGNQARWSQTPSEERGAPPTLTPLASDPPAAPVAFAPTSEASPTRFGDGVDLARALTAVPSFVAEPPVGAIRGRVVDADEQPIAGVTIKLSPLRGSSRAFTAEVWRDSLEEYITHRVNQHRLLHTQQRTAESGADGTFEFVDVAAAQFSAKASKPGYGFTVAPGPDGSTRFAAGDELRVLGVAAVAVPVRIVQPDGAAPSAATIIDFAAGQSRDRHPWTPAAARVELSAGHHILTADAGAAFRCEPQLVLISSDTPPPTLSFALLPTASLRVRWSLSARDPASMSQSCWYLEAGPDAEIDATELFRNGEQVWDTTRRGAEVTCEIRDLVPGHYWVGAGRGRVDALGSIEVRDGVAELALQVAEISDENVLKVTLLDAAGQPATASNAHFSIQNREGADWRRESVNMLKRTGHIYELLLPSECEAALTRGASEGWTLRVNEQDFAFSIPINSRDIVAQAPPRANFHLTVAPMPHAGSEDSYSVALHREAQETDANSYVSVDFDEDHWAATAVPGSYKVAVRRDGRELATREIMLVAGENVLVLPIEKGFRVSVRFANAEQAPPYLMLMSEDLLESVGHAEVKEQLAVFEDVPAGNYTLISARTQLDVELMNIAVAGETSVVFKAAKFHRLIVRILQPIEVDSPLAVLRDGDYVVGLEGKDITNIRGLALSFMSAMSKPEISVTLERGGERMEIKVPTQAILELENELDETIRIRPDLEATN